MKRARQAFSPSAAQEQRLVWWAVLFVALPLVLFCWWTYLQAPSRIETLTPVSGVQVWHEDIGNTPFELATFRQIVRKQPDWTKAEWTPIALLHFKELGAAIDLPPDAPKRRAWFRIPVPVDPDPHGRQGLLGFRVQGGPWAVWVDGQLIQANLSDWRIQWNVPLRVTVPLGAREVLLAVPYAEPQGFAVGTILVGPVDVVDTAWQERNLWHLDIPRVMAVVALLMMLVAFQLARARPHEPMFKMLGFNALFWGISCLQFGFDPTGQPRLSLWFGSAVDSSITWTVILSLIFALDYERVRAPRLRAVLVVFAAASTLLTLPLWDWQKNALIAQHYFNVVAYLVGLSVLGWHIASKPRREGVILFVALTTQLGLGVHTLQNLTNQTNPDSFYSFSLGTLALFFAFVYAITRRSVAALEASETHEVELRSRLDQQEAHLAAQHAQLQRLEVDKRLTTQHETIMQDLHDRLGSNLTSALLQARTGGLTPTDTVLLLQDLTDELRHIGKSTAQDQRGLSAILAELRQRVQHRLAQGGIELLWAVDPLLPAMAGLEISQHLRALLSEAIANVIKHAHATQIRLEAAQQGDKVLITITDDGQGFAPDAVEPGRGLPGMRQRAAALCASLHIGNQPAGGCCWQLTLPITNS